MARRILGRYVLKTKRSTNHKYKSICNNEKYRKNSKIFFSSCQKQFFFKQTNQKKKEKYGQAAEILYSLFKFKKLIRDRKLTADKEGDEPLCMSQYAKLFGCNRYPKPNRDVLSFNRYARHVIVLRNGYFFTLNIENETEQFLQPEMIRKRLQLICEKADQLPQNENFIGLFTSANRDVWADAYSSLQKFSDKNKKNLDIIAGAAFVLNLDSQSVDIHSEASSKLFLHNFGLILLSLPFSFSFPLPSLFLCLSSPPSLSLLFSLPFSLLPPSLSCHFLPFQFRPFLAAFSHLSHFPQAYSPFFPLFD